MNLIWFGMILLSLYLFDRALGNGFVGLFQKITCKVICFLKKTVKEEAKNNLQRTVTENPIKLPVILMEILVLTLTAAFLRKYKQIRGRDRLDELLNESKEAIRQTNEFLEKWRLRRIHLQVPYGDSYLDEEPQEIKPLRLEVPILHMAIVDTRGTARSLPERGDAGESINIIDSTLLSVTSLVDDDNDNDSPFNMEPIIAEKHTEEITNCEFNNANFSNRYLWDVMEEDSDIDD